MNPQHTPTPWRIGDAGHTLFGPRIDPCPYESVAPTMVAQFLRKADAAFIVQAVNAYEKEQAIKEELIHFVKEVKRVADDGMLTSEWSVMAKRLIAKASEAGTRSGAEGHP